MRKKRKWLWALALLVMAFLTLMTGWFRYYPQYKKTRAPINIAEEANDGICLLSQNLRGLTPMDFGKKSWFYRAPLIMQQIKCAAPGIIGFQEATSWQYEYLCDVLQDYDAVITYQDDREFSEGCPVFYLKTRYTLVESGSFWLSETPDIMSRSGDSQEYRICSYLVLEDTYTRREFAVFNTQLDHVSEDARIQGMQVIMDRVELLENIPFVIMGDLNTQEHSDTYDLAMRHCLDAQYEARITTAGPTYQDWGREDMAERTDYFLLSPEGITVERYDILSAEKEGIFFSDHNAIVMDMILDELRVMSYNIRIVTDSDKEERSWEVRKDLVLADILQLEPDVLCLQEVRPEQQAYLEQNLKDYAAYMVYRDDQENSEGCPVFWNIERFALADQGTVWLSRTPEVISIDWNAGCPRICTYVILEERSTQKKIGIFNTHLDHTSEEARVNGISVVLDLMEQFSDIPSILTGDFNTNPATDTYRIVTHHLEDGMHKAKHASGYGTYYAWGNLKTGRRIDYIMLSRESFHVHEYHVIPALHDGVYASDHCAVTMDAWFA